MPSEESGDAASPPSPEELYREFVRRQQQGEDIDIDGFCDEHPDVADTLRLLHSVARAHPSTDDSTTDLRLDTGGADASAKSSPFPSSLLDGGEWGPLGAKSPRAGERIGHYRLVRKLGEGGFGLVFLAEQEEPIRRQVALKLLRLGLGDQDVLLRFRLDYQALALMDHPHIAKVHDVGVTERGQPYFVMEYIRGEPITAFCDAHRLSVAERLRLFLRVCDAIQHAHLRTIIHRDIKPGNVLVSAGDSSEAGQGVPRVIDFGLAKAQDRQLVDGSPHTQTGQILGTPAYMSPEQTGMDPGAVDARTDIYSLGVLLYELLTGALPFDFGVDTTSFGEFQRRLVEDDPPPPHAILHRLGAESTRVALRRRTHPGRLRRELRGDLTAILLKALRKDPDERYRSAAEFGRDLERHLAHEPVLARAPGIVYRTRKYLRKHRMAASVVAAVVIVALAALGFGAYRERVEIRTTVDDFERALAASSLEEARAKWSFLQGKHPEIAATRRAGSELVRALVERAKESGQDFADLQSRLGDLHEAWLTERERDPQWRPVWERGEELRLWRQYGEARQGIEERFDAALRFLQEAREVARPGSSELEDVRRAFAEVCLPRYRDAVVNGSIEQSPDYYRRLIATYGPREVAERLGRGEKLALESVPPGAYVYCFRYEEREGRLMPFAYHPKEGVVGRPLLRVETVWTPELSPFAAGDRLLAVKGHDGPLEHIRDLVGVLSRTAQDDEVEVTVERGEGKVGLRWVPFPAAVNEAMARSVRGFENNRVLSFYHQFGFTLEAYPLQFIDANRVGMTPLEGRLEIELPRGSYLLVLRKEDYEDTRYPVAVPIEEANPEFSSGGASTSRVHLLRKEEIPPGFVYVAAGMAATGGDPEAFQGLPRRLHRLGGFFMSRLEVSTAEWRGFLNHPEVRNIIDPETGLKRETKNVRLVPRQKSGKLLWRERDGEWQPVYRCSPAWPVISVPRLAAEQYAAWRTRRAAEAAKPWRYRLPTDLEWERASRGVDRRVYVWGDYRVWNFCWSTNGIVGPVSPGIGGISPFDESVFGVRDLAGSVSEHTSGSPLPGFGCYRGGSYNQPDDFHFRAATRNGMVPTNFHTHFGVRLVADLAEPRPGGEAAR